MTILSDALHALSVHCQQTATTSALTFHRGVEREALRVERSKGRISHKPHPKTLGSAMTHSAITTDYSESLMEFITGVHPSVEGVIKELEDIHNLVNHELYKQDECLWPASMPCYLANNEDVPIAYYGESNTGKLKRVYREGLSNRYGRIMQCIAGMHYNFSFDADFWSFLENHKGKNSLSAAEKQTFQSDSYFALIRNFRRSSWMLSLLFGASPAIDESFLPKKPDSLTELEKRTWFGPKATSLRMSDLGYQNKAQADLYVCYNEVETYISTIKKALRTPYQRYQDIGVKVDGQYRQLNNNLLQIENEYYSDIRPKRVTQSGEHPSAALQARGVEYIEVRIMDLDPSSSIGMQSSTLYFIDVFLLYCMLRGDEHLGSAECSQLRKMQQEIASHGRDLDMDFDFGQGPTKLRSKAESMLNELTQVADFLSDKTGNPAYQHAVATQKEKLNDETLLPSAQLLERCKAQQGFQNAMLALSKEQQAQWMACPLTEELTGTFMEKAERSLRDQEAIEAADEVDFDTFLAAYLTPQ
ncbi:glutamate--cysteine ligase [Marinomonas sp. M1K-6]|uniref:Glutamate--cysteine ligase n=1 Tax=Marinomonas profundi TaxID=2726122 RepID=A0A847REP3_9GAMM|nr:glutamate--cysteine ligase [Marinomonas profundi]NLQ18740.1 glutamate--cysteine ligase [Marinomonas profundi]UDV04014.1 glutamate--cysteine ligase [Marinomonas profundi]